MRRISNFCTYLHSHIVQLMNGSLPAAVPMTVMKSFRNVGISLNRVGLQIRCAVTPNIARLWKKEGPTKTNAFGERKNGAEDRQVSLDFEGYVMNCEWKGSRGSRGGGEELEE
jgi:hypothetical protein